MSKPCSAYNSDIQCFFPEGHSGLHRFVSTIEKTTEEVGHKEDSEKDRWDLVPTKPLREIVKVLTFGAKKYGENNWQKVPNAKDRYYAAALRHLTAWWDGEKVDSETSLPHLAHAACCILFLLGFELGDTSMKASLIKSIERLIGSIPATQVSWERIVGQLERLPEDVLCAVEYRIRSSLQQSFDEGRLRNGDK